MSEAHSNNGPILHAHTSSGITRSTLSPSTADIVKVESKQSPMIPLSQTGRYDGPYIPVGSLSKLPGSAGYHPEEDIAILEKSNWIRTNSHEHSSNIQVFVLPNDVQAGSIQKARPKYKLRDLMNKIDYSSDAWNDLSNARPIQPDWRGLDKEDESLWYIFNTLQDPNPMPQTVKNVYARRAMEALLDESDNPVQGLKTALYPYQRRSAATMIQRETQPAMALDPRLQTMCGPTGMTFYYDKIEGTLLKGKRMYSEACGGLLTF